MSHINNKLITQNPYINVNIQDHMHLGNPNINHFFILFSEQILSKMVSNYSINVNKVDLRTAKFVLLQSNKSLIAITNIFYVTIPQYIELYNIYSFSMNFKIDQALLIVDPKGFIFSELQLPQPLNGLPGAALSQKAQISTYMKDVLKRNWVIYSPEDIVRLDFCLEELIQKLNATVRMYVQEIQKYSSHTAVMMIEETLLEWLQLLHEVVKRSFFYEIPLSGEKLFKQELTISSLFRYCDNFKILRMVSQIELRFYQNVDSFKLEIQDYANIRKNLNNIIIDSKKIIKTLLNHFIFNQKQENLTTDQVNKKFKQNKKVLPKIEIPIGKNHTLCEIQLYKLITEQFQQYPAELIILKLQNCYSVQIDLETRLKINLYIKLLKISENHLQMCNFIEMAKNLFIYKEQQFQEEQEYWKFLYEVSIDLLMIAGRLSKNQQPQVQLNQILSQKHSSPKFLEYILFNKQKMCFLNDENLLVNMNFYYKNTEDIQQRTEIEIYLTTLIEKLMRNKEWGYAEDIFQFLDATKNQNLMQIVFQTYHQILQQYLFINPTQNVIKGQNQKYQQIFLKTDLFLFERSMMHFFKFYLAPQLSSSTVLSSSQKSIKDNPCYFKLLFNIDFLKRLNKMLHESSNSTSSNKSINLKEINMERKKRINHFVFNQIMYFCNAIPEFQMYLSEMLQDGENLKVFIDIMKCYFNNNQIVFKLNFKIMHIIVNRIYQNKTEEKQQQIVQFYWKVIMKLLLLWGPKSYLDQQLLTLTPYFDRIVDQLMKFLPQLAKTHLDEQNNIRRYLECKGQYNNKYIHSWLKMMAFKNKSLSQNLLHISIFLKEHLPEDQFGCILKFVSELTTPLIIGRNKNINVLSSYLEEFDDIIIDYPLQCIEITHSYFKKYVNLDLKWVLTTPKLFWTKFWNTDRDQFLSSLIEEKITPQQYKSLQGLRQLQFFLTLFNSIIEKLKQEVKYSMKNIHEIYEMGIKIVDKIRKVFSNVLSTECVDRFNQKSQELATLSEKKNRNPIHYQILYALKQKEALTKNNSSLGFEKMHFYNIFGLMKQIKLFIDSFSIINVGQYSKLVEKELKNEFQVNYHKMSYLYITIGRTIEIIRTIQMYCGFSSQLERKIKNSILLPLSQYSIIYLTSRFKQLKNFTFKIDFKDTYLTKLNELVLKQLKRYFIAYLVTDLISHKNKYDKVTFQYLLGLHIELHRSILAYIKSVYGFYEETHNIYLEIIDLNIEEFLKAKLNQIYNKQEDVEKYQNNIQSFLVQIFNLFMYSTFQLKTRVRSAIFYELINKYELLTLKSRKMFNGVILHYLKINFQRFIDFEYTQQMKFLKGEESVQMELYSNQLLLIPELICTQAMIINLLSRNNYMVLADGIRGIFKGKAGLAYYIKYLIKVSQKLCEFESLASNDLQTIIIDVYGNLEIILQEAQDEGEIESLIILLKLVFNSKLDIREVSTMLIKLILQQFFLKPCLKYFQGINLYDYGYRAFILIAVSLEAKLIPRCRSNLHLLNVMYLDQQTTKNIRLNWGKILQNNDQASIHQLAMQIMNENNNSSSNNKTNIISNCQEYFLQDWNVQVPEITDLIESFIQEFVRYINSQVLKIDYYLYFKLLIALAIKLPTLIDQIFYYQLDIAKVQNLIIKPSTFINYYQGREKITFIQFILDTLQYSYRLAAEFVIFILKTNSGFELSQDCHTLVSNTFIKINLIKIQLLSRVTKLIRKGKDNKEMIAYLTNITKLLQFIIKKEEGYIFTLYRYNGQLSQDVAQYHKKIGIRFLDQLIEEISQIMGDADKRVLQSLLGLFFEAISIKFLNHNFKSAQVEENIKYYLNMELMEAIQNGDGIKKPVYRAQEECYLEIRETSKKRFQEIQNNKNITNFTTTIDQKLQNCFLSRIYNIYQIGEDDIVERDSGALVHQISKLLTTDQKNFKRAILNFKINQDLSSNIYEELQISEKRLQLPSFDQRSITLNDQDDIFFQNDEFLATDSIDENKIQTSCSSICDMVFEDNNQNNSKIENENRLGLIKRVQKLDLMRLIEQGIDISSKIQYLSNEQLLQLEMITDGKLRIAIEKERQLRGMSSTKANTSLFIVEQNLSTKDELFPGCKKNEWVQQLMRSNQNSIPTLSQQTNINIINLLISNTIIGEQSIKLMHLIEMICYNNINMLYLANYMFLLLSLKENELKIMIKEEMCLKFLKSNNGNNKNGLTCILRKIKTAVCRLVGQLMVHRLGLPLWYFAEFCMKERKIVNLNFRAQVSQTFIKLKIDQPRKSKLKFIEIIFEIIIQECKISSSGQQDFTQLIATFKDYLDHPRTYQGCYPFYDIHYGQQFTQKQLISSLVTNIFQNKRRLKDDSSIYSNILKILFRLYEENCYELFISEFLKKIGEELKNIVEVEISQFQKFKKLVNLTEQNIKEILNQNTLKLEKLVESYSAFVKREYKLIRMQELRYLKHLMSDLCFDIIPWFKNFKITQQNKDEIKRLQELQKQDLKQIKFFRKTRNLQQLQRIEYKQKKEAAELRDYKNKLKNDLMKQFLKPLHDTFSVGLLSAFERAMTLLKRYNKIFFLNTDNNQDIKILLPVYKTQSYFWKIIISYYSVFQEQETNAYHTMSILKTTASLQSNNQLISGKNIKNRRSKQLSIYKMNPYSLNNIMKKLMSNIKLINPFIKEGSRLIKILAKEGELELKLKYFKKKKTGNVKEIQIKRNQIWFNTITSIDNQFIEKDIRIKFKNQLGVDYGGLTREWLTLLTKELFNPNFGLFQLSKNKLSVQPSRNSHLVPYHLLHFRKLGILVGKAIIQDWHLEINFTKSFLKHLLGSPIFVQDLEDIDPDTTRSLLWILDNQIDESLQITFSYQLENLGQITTINLIENGENVYVNEENKKQYVKLICKSKMTQQIRVQSKAFISGLEEVIPYQSLRYLNYKQFGLYLAGLPIVNINQMKIYAKYNNYSPEDEIIVWFWEILLEFDTNTIANFLFFLTGTFKVPYEGFKEYPITISKSYNKDHLPVSHTCFSTLDLPQYQSRKSLQKKLLLSIAEGKGFNVS